MSQEDFKRILRPKKQKPFNKEIFGFDIETCDDNKRFVMASIYGHNYLRVFWDKDELIRYFKTETRLRNNIIFATNLAFDFFGTFFKSKEISNFDYLNSKSRFLSMFTRIKGKEFTFPSKENKGYDKITFIDTMNYGGLSVESMGEILGIPKLNKPKCFIKSDDGDYNVIYPESDDDRLELAEYNIRDSEISYKFMKFLIDGFMELGSDFKITIGSTSMSLFLNKYLKGYYILPDEEILRDLFNGYYGGRTEVFKRGHFKSNDSDKWSYYDFNSLYPSVMHDYYYPDTNHLKISTKDTLDYIKEYDGMSKVDIYCPYMKYPLLPVRYDGKLLFPTGSFTGYYTHAELRKALELGYQIRYVHKSYYCEVSCSPFKDFVSDLYNKRLEYKKQNNEMEYIIKMLLNNLYGKFGQKFDEIDRVKHRLNVTEDDLLNKNFDDKHEFYVLKEKTKPSVFCNPLWASYITAYGRIKLHDQLVKGNAIYCDTDSLITLKELENSKELGLFKKEMDIKEGIIVKPKFYGLVAYDHDHVRIKGLNKRLDYLKFLGFLKEPKVKYNKFAKFRESIKRGLVPNEIIKAHKELDLEDNKRSWPSDFDYDLFQDSDPININDLENQKIMELMGKMDKNKLDEFIDSDLFDKEAVGSDISYEEYIKNEQFFERLGDG